MSYYIIYDETFGFRFDPEESKIDPLTSMRFSYHGPSIPFEKNLKEVLLHKTFKDGGHLLWYGINVKLPGSIIQQRCKIGKVHYRPMRLAMCHRFDVAYDTLPVPGLVRNCDSAICIEPSHMMPKGYKPFKIDDPLSDIRDDTDLYSDDIKKKIGGFNKDDSVEISAKGIQDFMDKINKMGEK